VSVALDHLATIYANGGCNTPPQPHPSLAWMWPQRVAEWLLFTSGPKAPMDVRRNTAVVGHSGGGGGGENGEGGRSNGDLLCQRNRTDGGKEPE
jgi:hypothetical protein